jgi:hypothetical protein
VQPPVIKRLMTVANILGMFSIYVHNLHDLLYADLWQDTVIAFKLEPQKRVYIGDFNDLPKDSQKQLSMLQLMNEF